MRIKGRHVCLVEIDFDYQYECGMLPMDEIKAKTMGGELTRAIRDVVSGEIIDDYGTVTVTQQYADLYEVNDGSD